MASVTFTVNEKEPAAVGVPLIRPDDDKVKPAGSDPELREKVYDGVPPEACTCEEKGTPTRGLTK